MDSPEIQAATEFIREYGSDGPFIPCAYYDDEMDCTCIRIRDCSVIMVETDAAIGIRTSAKPDDNGEVVGFDIYGVRARTGKSLPEILTMVEDIDTLLKKFPEIATAVAKMKFPDRD